MMVLAVVYLAFISLGLPDAVIGAAWPVMAPALGTDVSNMGIVTMIVSAGTIFSSLHSHRLTHRFGVHTVTVVSVGITALSLLGFGYAPYFWMLCLVAIPYGLGAGSVDAALNNYVAIHFQSKHMNWLHCMWGIGATMGPYLMGWVLSGGGRYCFGYLLLGLTQTGITVVLLASKPAWNAKDTSFDQTVSAPCLSLGEIFQIKGVPQVAVAFFCFCALEHTTGLWASSYLVYARGLAAETAAGCTALFYLGITVGRFVCGFLSTTQSDTQLIRGGTKLMALGVVIVLCPLGTWTALLGLGLIGLGSAPVYPAIIHSTPSHFGVTNSPAVTGVQMACAYTGSLAMPALFGVLSQVFGFGLYPIYIVTLLLGILVFYEWLLKTVAKAP